MSRRKGRSQRQEATKPHRRTTGDVCGRCLTPWPCTSVVEGYDVGPSVTAGTYPESTPRGARLSLVLDGLVMDSGNRQPDRHGRPGIMWILTPEALLSQGDNIP
jgi:hypothetical protein